MAIIIILIETLITLGSGLILMTPSNQEGGTGSPRLVRLIGATTKSH